MYQYMTCKKKTWLGFILFNYYKNKLIILYVQLIKLYIKFICIYIYAHNYLYILGYLGSPESWLEAGFNTSLWCVFSRSISGAFCPMGHREFMTSGWPVQGPKTLNFHLLDRFALMNRFWILFGDATFSTKLWINKLTIQAGQIITTSLFSKWDGGPYFRLVNYYNFPRYNVNQND